MALAKRIGLFLGVNILVVLTISTLLSVLGVKPYLTAQGIQYSSLIVFCLVWGMGGAFISLALSRIMAKWMMGVKVIPANTQDPELRELVQTVYELSRAAKLPAMPEVGVYESPEINAFATGPTKARSLVAVSSGLLRELNEKQIRGVLGHEVAHIANGDMVTMTLIQGIVNAFVMFLARAIAYALTMSKGQDSEEGSSAGPSLAYYATQIVLEIFFMILGSMVVAWFSRYREYRADIGGAKLAGSENMIFALQGLQRTMNIIDVDTQPSAVQAMKISSRGGKFMKLFSTHPPLEERILRLQNSRR
jgi:heat shock protein HtpX